jgi:hypothetical protein
MKVVMELRSKLIKTGAIKKRMEINSIKEFKLKQSKRL